MATGSSSQFEKMSIGDRIRYLMEVREIKQVVLAKQINPQWIIDGKGDPFTWAPVTKEAEVELLKLFKTMVSPATAPAVVDRQYHNAHTMLHGQPEHGGLKWQRTKSASATTARS